ncbi:MAG: hypothetical protein ABWZ66_13040 [Pyrinomonadaceae bacterium]
MKVAERKGELIPASEVKDAIQTIFSNLHREFMWMHKRIGARLAKAKTAQEETLILQTEDGKIFNRLRDNYTDFLGKRDG